MGPPSNHNLNFSIGFKRLGLYFFILLQGGELNTSEFSTLLDADRFFRPPPPKRQLKCLVFGQFGFGYTTPPPNMLACVCFKFTSGKNADVADYQIIKIISDGYISSLSFKKQMYNEQLSRRQKIQ